MLHQLLHYSPFRFSEKYSTSEPRPSTNFPTAGATFLANFATPPSRRPLRRARPSRGNQPRHSIFLTSSIGFYFAYGSNLLSHSSPPFADSSATGTPGEESPETRLFLGSFSVLRLFPLNRLDCTAKIYFDGYSFVLFG